MSYRGFLNIHPNTIGSFESLKKHYILFDELTASGVNSVFDQPDAYAPGLQEELTNLLDMNILINMDNKLPDENALNNLASENSEFSRILKEKKSAECELKKSEEDPILIDHLRNSDGLLDFEKLLEVYTPLKNIVQLEHLREKLISEYFSLKYQDTYLPLSFQELHTGFISTIDVINLTIGGFPVIRDDVKWERLYDFKNEDDTKIKTMRFRKFTKKLLKENLTINEIKEEIEWMLEEYKQHIKSAKLKFNTGMIESILLPGSKFIENIIQLKPAKAIGSLYEIKKKRIELLNVELNAPGKEVALLASLKKLY